MIRQHSGYVQIFYPDNSVVLADIGRDFVQRILTNVCNLSVQYSYLNLSFLRVGGMMLFVAIKPLKTREFILVLLVCLNTFKHFSCRERSKMINPQIYANYVNLLFCWFRLNFNLERNKPSVSRSRNRCTGEFYSLGQPLVGFYPTNNWNLNLSVVNCYAAI